MIETWVCEECGTRFVLSFYKGMMCAAHGDDDHCHIGEIVIDKNGRQHQWAATRACLPFATSEWKE